MVLTAQDTDSPTKNQTTPFEWCPFPENNRLRCGISLVSDGEMNWRDGSEERVRGNRERYFDKQNLDPLQAVTLDQVHGNSVIRVTTEHAHRGVLNPRTRIQETDGMVTNEPGLILITSHADCAPIYIYDPENSVVGLVHAGWRGTLAGIAGEAIRAMKKEFNSDPRKLEVAIGPTISTAHYEVGEDVAAKFMSRFRNQVVVKKELRTYLDLVSAITSDLLDNGLNPDHIPHRPPCTFSNSHYGSYRREGKSMTGMLAWLTIN